MILSGEKTIESRLYRSRQAPVGRVGPGDIIYIKQASGPFRARATVSRVLEQEVTSPQVLATLHKKYEPRIRGGEDYWISKAAAKYAVLMWLTSVEPCETGPARTHWRKPGTRQAWFTLDAPQDVAEAAPRAPARASKPKPMKKKAR